MFSSTDVACAISAETHERAVSFPVFFECCKSLGVQVITPAPGRWGDDLNA